MKRRPRPPGLKALQTRSMTEYHPGNPGIVQTKEKSIGLRGKPRAMVFGVLPGLHGTVGDPAFSFSRMFSSAMRRPPRPPCIVYDANGKEIARIDGETRERTPSKVIP